MSNDTIRDDCDDIRDVFRLNAPDQSVSAMWDNPIAMLAMQVLLVGPFPLPRLLNRKSNKTTVLITIIVHQRR